MVSSDTIRNVVGILGNIISFFLFLSPLPTFIDIWKKKSVKQYSSTPYIATLQNSLVLILYGMPMVHPKNMLIVTINGIGATIELSYIIVFIVFSNKKSRMKVILILVLQLIFITILTLLVLTLAHTTTKRSLVVGCFSICFNIMMYASPLSIMKLVITTKSVEYMPFFLSFATFCNAAAWGAYAFIHFDVFLVIPNGVGAVLAMFQLLLYAVFYKSTKLQIEERKAMEELGLSEVGDSKKPGNGVVEPI
ncbi:bidirectional sugar transporter SWEET4-like [Euphorbia lathyris]|uniref:bidirectional sugar transporter SWEET4-like n=1 Tax=Euphorbia lathyris TaxID=212925 RepID=UPI003313474C